MEVPNPSHPTRHRGSKRSRRWSREMLGIYIGLPLVFIALAVSIGVVEYRPIDPKDSQRARADQQREIDRVGRQMKNDRLILDRAGLQR